MERTDEITEKDSDDDDDDDDDNDEEDSDDLREDTIGNSVEKLA